MEDLFNTTTDWGILIGLVVFVIIFIIAFLGGTALKRERRAEVDNRATEEINDESKI